MKQPTIEITKQWKGHSAPINCLDIHPTSHLLLSGSDDGTARIWDLRMSTITISSSSAAAVSTLSSNNNNDNLNNNMMTSKAVTAVAWDPSDTDSGCYVANETILSWYDTRMERCIQIFQCNDEINQIVSCKQQQQQQQNNKQQKNKKSSSQSHKHKTSSTSRNSKTSIGQQSIPIVACADDAGQVNVWNRNHTEMFSSLSSTNTWQHCHTLSHGSDDTLVLSCALDEKAKYLVTGTSDCLVRLWSWTTGQLVVPPMSMTAMQQQQQQQQQQLYNPPMIHTLTWMPLSTCFVAGCGDGSLAIGNTQGVWLSRIDTAHGGSIVKCCPFGKAEWGCLASTGNDGQIVLWDMQSILVSSSSSSSSSSSRNKKETVHDWLLGTNNTNDNEEDALTQAMETWNFTSQIPQTLFAWDHGINKPNDMIASDTTLLVADTSTDITMYTIRPGM